MTAERFPIEAGHVLMFARAIGEENPAYSDPGHAGAGGPLAPPTFTIAAAQWDPDYPLRPHAGRPWHGSGATPGGPAPQRPAAQTRPTSPTDQDGEPARTAGTRPAPAGGLRAEQHFTYHRPLRVGDVLHATTVPGRTWEKSGRTGSLRFAERITEYRDDAGELVVTARHVGVRREPHRAPAPDQG